MASRSTGGRGCAACCARPTPSSRCPSSRRARSSSLRCSGAERIRVVPNGVDPGFFARATGPEEPEGDYVLAVATLEPRKNLGRVVEAARLAGVELRVVGARGWGGVEVPGWVGEVPDAELAELYRGARCVLYPSLYEGFGLPVLEAMACGTPVVTSSGTAMEEVAGGAARPRRSRDARSRSPRASPRPRRGVGSSSPSASRARRSSRGPPRPTRSRRCGGSSREHRSPPARGRRGTGDRKPCFLPRSPLLPESVGNLPVPHTPPRS